MFLQKSKLITILFFYLVDLNIRIPGRAIFCYFVYLLLFRIFDDTFYFVYLMILVKGVQINRKREEANKQEGSIKLEGVGGRNGCTRFVFYST